MRIKFLLLVSILASLSIPVEAQHQATPVDELIRQFRAANPVHDHAAMLNAPTTPSSPVPDGFDATAAKTFNITAHQFAYTVSPLPFQVNAGDSVTLNLTSSDVTHGFQMERYTGSLTIRSGQTTTQTFIANTAGTFTYFCTIFCGSGHGGMDGQFVVTAASNPAPTVTSFTPTSGSTEGGTSVTVTGTNFQAGATVRFGAVDATGVTFISSTSLTATAPAQAAGSVAITVTNPDGQNANRTGFTYVAPPSVSITTVTPASGSTAGGETIVISGSGFNAGAIALINGLPLTGVTVTSTSISGSTPRGPANFVSSLMVDVVVTNPDGSSATKSKGFTYTVPDPAIDSISTRSASPSGGTPVTIFGKGFTSASPISVSFGGIAGTAVTVINATTLSVIAPAHAIGVVDVTVTVGTRSATLAGAITYQVSTRRRAVRS